MGQLLSIFGLLYIRNCDVMKVVDDVSLFPPYPKYYQVNPQEERFTGTYDSDGKENNIPESVSIRYVKIVDNIDVCLMHCKSTSSKRVLIYSHGNAVDMGCCIRNMIDLGQELDTDIILYDYEGFGCSKGVAKCDRLTRDLTAVYNYAKEFFHGKDIFFIGESIGSVPSCTLAASLSAAYENNKLLGIHQDIPLGGVILQSALYSGATSLPGGCLIRNKDPYNNASQVKSIRCPIFHIHGTDDEIIPFSRGKELYMASESAYPPWWVEGGKHNDIMKKHEEEYKQHLLCFMDYCNEIAQNS